MKFKPMRIPDLVLIEPDVFKDDRGFFFEAFHTRKYKEAGLDLNIVQLNHSKSKKGTLRGLHFQKDHPQAKLIRVLAGEIFDVGVDIRRGSPTFGRWEGAILSSENFKIIYIPEGFAHGFCVLSEVAEVEYTCTDFYASADEVTLAWNDPDLKIEWPVKSPLLSKRDQQAVRFKDLTPQLPVYKEPLQLKWVIVDKPTTHL